MSPYDWLRYLASTRGARMVFPLHRWVLRVTRGRLLATSGRMPVLLLTTIGRRTGQPRTWPLAYLRDGETLVVVASNRGEDRPPAWYLNLLANPAVVVEIRGMARPMRAAIATAEERARLWPLALRADPLYGAYEHRTTREIPLVLLHPAE